MSNSPNPFSEQLVRSPDTSSSRSLTWALVVLAVILTGLLYLLWSIHTRDQQRMLTQQKKLDAVTAQTEAIKVNHAEIQQESARLRARIQELEEEKAMAAQMARGLEDQMRAELESKDVTISKLQGKLTVNILDRILFDSGEAILKSDGESVLRKIAAILAQHPELKIHVVGHTDNVPIRISARSRFASNWELSTARALAAVRFLTEQAGVAPQRLGAVGYGEFRPVVDNNTAEGRARNRRIAITILGDELAGADTQPQPDPMNLTNAPVGADGSLPPGPAK